MVRRGGDLIPHRGGLLDSPPFVVATYSLALLAG